MADQIILMGDRRVAAVPVVDCGEPLVEAGSQFVRSRLKAEDEPHRSRVRSGLLTRLEHAAADLPSGLALAWVEGHRRADLQESYFDRYRAGLRAADPTVDDDTAYQLASRYVSPPSVAPHVSGAAIDLTLCETDGTELDLGTAVNATPEESAGACFTAAAVPPEARRNRQLLVAVLTGAGLVNYPTEWWHWSFGDRYWALITGRPHAMYGPVIPGRAPEASQRADPARAPR